MDNKVREQEIDIAKFIGIIAVIVGHTVSRGTFARAVIYSFHMPLFYFINGINYRPLSQWSDLNMHLKKDFIRLLIPAICISVIRLIINTVMSGSPFDLMKIVKDWGGAFFWATPMVHPGLEYSLGAEWFLVNLFWVRLLFALIGLLFRSEISQNSLYLLTGIMGMILGDLERIYCSPQNLIVSLVGVMFLWFGYLFGDYKKRKKNVYIAGFFFIAFVVWVYSLQKGLYLEMAIGFYSSTIVSIIEALCAIYVVLFVSKTLGDNRLVNKVFSLYGRHSMSILSIHCLDLFIISRVLIENEYAKSIISVFIDLMIVTIFLTIKNVISKYKKDKKVF